jgi:hypothetical protein
MDPGTGVVKSLESTVRFGLVLYTWDSGACPNLVEIMPPALNAHASIDAVYSTQVPINNTPTGDSIAAITPEILAFAEPGPKLLILATDGDPDRCEDPDGHDDVSKQEVIDAVTTLHGSQVETVIIAVGDQVSDLHQQDVANAGKGFPVPAANPCNDPMTCAPTYEPANQAELVAALTDIINGKRTCVFTLNGAVIPGKECDGTVIVNGQSIPCNDPNGWKLNTPTEIEFVGATCDLILNAPMVDGSASFPCESIADPPA